MNSGDLFVSVSPALRSQAYTAVPGLYVHSADPKGSLCAYAVGTLPIEIPSPQLLGYMIIYHISYVSCLEFVPGFKTAQIKISCTNSIIQRVKPSFGDSAG